MQNQEIQDEKAKRGNGIHQIELNELLSIKEGSPADQNNEIPKEIMIKKENEDNNQIEISSSNNVVALTQTERDIMACSLHMGETFGAVFAEEQIWRQNNIQTLKEIPKGKDFIQHYLNNEQDFKFQTVDQYIRLNSEDERDRHLHLTDQVLFHFYLKITTETTKTQENMRNYALKCRRHKSYNILDLRH